MNTKSTFDKFKERPFWQRLLLFVIVVVLWFTVMNALSEDTSDPIESARDTNGHWLITVLFLAIISPLFFTYRRDK